MKVIVVVLILIQISLIVTNPNNTIESKQKESKGIGKNLSQQSRGLMGWLKNVVGRAKDAVNVKSFLDAGKTYAKTAFNFAGENTKSFKDVPKIVKSVKTLTGFLKK